MTPLPSEPSNSLQLLRHGPIRRRYDPACDATTRRCHAINQRRIMPDFEASARRSRGRSKRHTAQSIAYGPRSRTPSAYLQATIDRRQVTTLIDTGADYSVMIGPFLAQLKKVRTKCNSRRIRTAGGHLVTPTGKCTARVTLRGHAYPVNFVVRQQ